MTDAGLQEKLKAAGGDADAVVAIAKAADFVISIEELKRAQAGVPEIAELSDEELEGVAGGTGTVCGTFVIAILPLVAGGALLGIATAKGKCS